MLKATHDIKLVHYTTPTIDNMAINAATPDILIEVSRIIQPYAHAITPMGVTFALCIMNPCYSTNNVIELLQQAFDYRVHVTHQRMDD